MGGTNQEKDPDSLSILELQEGGPRPASQVLTRMHIVLKDGSVHTMMYHHLDSNPVFSSGSFVLTFVAAKHWQIQVTGWGKKFWRIFDYITRFRWPYFCGATRDFPSGRDNLVSSDIKITDVTPRERE
jgi:hypothetical protein